MCVSIQAVYNHTSFHELLFGNWIPAKEHRSSHLSQGTPRWPSFSKSWKDSWHSWKNYCVLWKLECIPFVILYLEWFLIMNYSIFPKTLFCNIDFKSSENANLFLIIIVRFNPNEPYFSQLLGYQNIQFMLFPSSMHLFLCSGILPVLIEEESL